MAQQDVGREVMDSIGGPINKAIDTAKKYLGMVPSPGASSSSTGAETDYSRSEHAKAVAAANASYAKSAAGQAHGQTARRQRLARKYAGKK